MPRRGFARDMLAIKDHLDRALARGDRELRGDKIASQLPGGDRSDRRASWSGIRTQRHRPGSTRWASRSIRTSIRR